MANVFGTKLCKANGVTVTVVRRLPDRSEPWLGEVP